MGCQQSKAKEQPVVSPALPVVVEQPKSAPPVVVATKPAPVVEEPAREVSEPREASPVVPPPEEVTVAPPTAPSAARSTKSVSVCSSLASDTVPDLASIFKHNSLETMLKRWNQRQKLDAHAEAAHFLVKDVLGEESLTGMFKYRSFTPSPVQQDLFHSLMQSFASPPRDMWSASPRRQCALGSLSPVGSPRTGLRAPQPTCVLTEEQGSGSSSLATPDDLIAMLFAAADEPLVETDMVASSPRVAPKMSLSAAPSPARFGERAPSVMNISQPTSPQKRRADDATATTTTIFSFAACKPQNVVEQSENAVVAASPTKAVSFETSVMRKTAPVAGKTAKSKGCKKIATTTFKKGPVASRWEKGSQAQMQPDVYAQMANAFERQLTNKSTIDSQMSSR